MNRGSVGRPLARKPAPKPITMVFGVLVTVVVGVSITVLMVRSVVENGFEGLWLRALIWSVVLVLAMAFMVAALLDKLRWRPRILGRPVEGTDRQGVLIRCRITPQLGVSSAILAPGLWCAVLLAICWSVGMPAREIDIQFIIAAGVALAVAVLSLGHTALRVTEAARGRLVRGYVALTPDRLLLRLPTWRAELAWERVEGVSAGPNKVVQLHATGSPVVWTSRLWPKGRPPGTPTCIHVPGLLLVPEPALLVEAIQHYLAHPELRDELGDERGVRRVGELLARR